MFTFADHCILYHFFGSNHSCPIMFLIQLKCLVLLERANKLMHSLVTFIITKPFKNLFHRKKNSVQKNKLHVFRTYKNDAMEYD